MPRPLENASELERLKAEVRDVERRVAFLESLQNIARAEPLAMHAAPVESAFQLPDAAPVVGRAVLGLAGAYMFRALAELGVMPRLAIVAAAIVYAGTWLWLAARRRSEGNTASSSIYALTAVLILSPLLWEATTRFGLLPHFITAALLVAFPALGSLLGVAGWPIIPAAFATAITLMIQTGDLLPFAIATMLISALAETVASRGLRAVSALAAMGSVFLLVWIAGRSGGAPAGYSNVRPLVIALCACALPLICLIGVAKRRSFGFMEAGLLTPALAVSVYGAPVWASGSILIALCAACAWLSLCGHAHGFTGGRIAELSALPLGLAGSFLLLATPFPASALWCAASVLVTLFSTRRRDRILAFHGVALLASAALFSGFFVRAVVAFTGPVPGPATLPVALIGLSAALAWRLSTEFVWPRLAFASFTIIAAGALLLELSGMRSSLLPAFQTLYLCVAATGASYAAGKSRPELGWIAYGLLMIGAMKLLAIDFRESRPEILAVSLICYGVALILVPRLKTRRQIKRIRPRNIFTIY